MKFEKKLKLDVIQDSENLTALITEDDVKKLGQRVCQSYDVDKQSRRKWETRMEAATELALQVTKPKSYPWTNASNVKFPLLTIASLQFASRAYPALVKAPDLVKFRKQGSDDGAKSARAARISNHMSYQMLEQDERWEEDQDRAFIALPILGCIFKKSYYDPIKGHNCSKLVLPKDLVVHYYARSLDDCERKTEIFQLYDREIKERELRGTFTENDYGPTGIDDPRPEDKRQGLSTPFNDDDRPRTFLEQHCYLDLDGDGYKEPYVVTVEQKSQKVARIVARFANVTTEQSVKIEELNKRMKALAEGLPQMGEGQQASPQDLQQAQAAEQTLMRMQDEIESLASQKPKVLRIKPIEYYTKYGFIPAPDGGFYDIGFGLLLGDLGDSVNSLINQLIDSGSLQNSNSGFLGKGARIKGGKVRFEPNTWHRVNVAGGTLRDSIVPMPVNSPSPVLFQLLSLLITYSERVSSVTDTMMGENPGQNTPAYNMKEMVSQGLQVFNGIFKRVYRSFRGEIRKLYALNGIYLDQEEYFSYQDSDSKALATDYTADAKDLIPAADPNAFSNAEKLQKAQMIAARSMEVSGYDPIVVEKRLLEAQDIADASEVFPLVQDEQGNTVLKFPPQPNPEFEIKREDLKIKALEAQSNFELKSAESAAKIAESEAKIILMTAQAAETADKPELERLKLLAKDLGDQRKAIIEASKIETDRGMGGKPDYDTS